MMNGYKDKNPGTGAERTGMGEERIKDAGPDSGEKNREYALSIMEALSGVDGELLEKCGRTRAVGRETALGKRRIWRLAGTWAAVFCIAAAGTASWMGWQIMQPKGSDSSGAGVPYGNEAQPPFSGGMNQDREGAAGGDACAPEDFPEGEQEVNAGQGPAGDEAAGTAYGTAGETAEPGQESGEDRDGADFGSIEDKLAENGMAPEAAEAEDSLQSPGMKLNAVNYTEEEARNLEDIGEYIPDTLPAGYVFGGAYSDPDWENPNLTVCWVRGRDRIVLRLERTEGDIVTADRERPETYDERLYELPFGETVPAEYREILACPVFALEDLDLEVIESRMPVFEDSGDTAVPSGNFGVLYPGNVLISFSGQGTAEEIWDMFSSIESEER